MQRRGVRALGRRRLGFDQGNDERPSARARGRPEAREPTGMRTAARRSSRGRGAPRDAERSEGVVRDLARPHEVPERGKHDIVIGGSGCGDEVGPEARAGPQQTVADRVVYLAVGCALERGTARQQAHAVTEEHADPAVVGAERARADPDELARRAQLVEHARAVAVDARRQHVALEDGSGNRHPLQLLECLDQGVGSAPASSDVLPGAQEARVGGGVDRLDLVPEGGE